MKLALVVCFSINMLGVGNAWSQASSASSTASTRWAPDAKASVIKPSGDRPAAAPAASGMPGRTPNPTQDQHLSDPILIGAIDLHAHFGPDPSPREWDAFDIAKHSAQSGMRAMVFKSHWSETASLAYLVRKHADIGNFQVFGGIALNASVGGINPQAVQKFIDVEGHYGKIVWMPTRDSEQEVRTTGAARPYVRVSEDGVLLPQVLEVLDLIKQHDLTLATGHVSAADMLLIAAAANARAIDRIIVTHPGLEPEFTDPSIAQMKQAVALGCYMEIVSNEFILKDKNKFIAVIREIGPQHVFVSSDSGSRGSPYHSDALVISIKTLRAAGFSEADLDLMFRKNPAKLIGLQPH